MAENLIFKPEPLQVYESRIGLRIKEDSLRLMEIYTLMMQVEHGHYQAMSNPIQLENFGKINGKLITAIHLLTSDLQPSTTIEPFSSSVWDGFLKLNRPITFTDPTHGSISSAYITDYDPDDDGTLRFAVADFDRSWSEVEKLDQIA